jgi:hypothetical protein
MIIPSKDPFRIEKILEIRDACLSSQNERRELYAKRRKYFMFGSDDYRQVRYNRLFAHLDLVASFLYSPDTAKFNLAPPRNSPAVIEAQALALQDEWNQQFRDTGLAYLYGIALIWSLVYDSMYLKVGFNRDRGRLTGKLVMPNAFGVYDEMEPELDNQEAFCHTYRETWDRSVLRLYSAGLADRVKDLGVAQGAPIDDLPPVLKQLLITQTGGQNLSGNLMGQAPLDIQPVILYEPKSNIPTVEWQELWIWDDINEDYATFIIADPDILITDTRESIRLRAEKAKLKKQNGGGEHDDEDETPSASNEFLPGEYPFVPITPYQLPDYAFGESHAERLIPLQNWTSERLDQIAEVLESQVDPSKVFSGFMGLSDEKASAFGGPGTWVLDSLPGAKVDKQTPQMPEDLFVEFKEIGAIFLEASGLTETITGQGGKNIRGKSQSRQAAITGSSRIKKIAVGLEPSLIQLGDLALKLFMNWSKEDLLLPDGSKFLPKLFAAEHWNLRIAGHSHSPLFADEARELAAILLKAQSIDREMFVRLMSPPQEDTIISALRERIKVEQQIAARNPELLAKAGGGSKGKEARR